MILRTEVKADSLLVRIMVQQPIFFESFNLAFTFATLDLKMNWRRYKEDLEKEFMK